MHQHVNILAGVVTLCDSPCCTSPLCLQSDLHFDLASCLHKKDVLIVEDFWGVLRQREAMWHLSLEKQVLYKLMKMEKIRFSILISK